MLIYKKSWVFIAVSLLFQVSCQKTHWSFLSLDKIFWSNESNGTYFPGFISEIFPYASYFQEQFKNQEVAKSGIKIIQIQQLTQHKTPSHEASLSWSRNGYLLGYEVVKNRQRKILLRDLSQSYSKTLAIFPVDDEPFYSLSNTKPMYRSYNAFLRWSYDSKQYSFMSNGGLGDFNIYVGAIDSDEHLIAPNPAKDGFATWNPQHHEIVFTSARTGKGDLYLFRRGVRENRLTFNDTPDLYPEWAKDGEGIIFISGDLQKHKMMVLLRDRRSRMWHRPYPFIISYLEQMRPIISPNGRFVAFYSMGQDGKWNLHVLPFIRDKTYSDEHLKKSIIARNVFLDLNSGVAWTPDSKKIFYIENNLAKANRIFAYHLTLGKRYLINTNTSMNHDLIMSKLGILSFCAQSGSWDRVFMALTNQGIQIQGKRKNEGNLHIKYIH